MQELVFDAIAKTCSKMVIIGVRGEVRTFNAQVLDYVQMQDFG
jgi:hypothetical protein